ncbi:DUF2938 domain-containing protein [Pseudomonas benzenivorans]|uniref:DUF2938 domain-containing protein n=1 Tax=Pseudomonas benzenivorans TaxID=556533 RepID=A0ABY5H5F2_9PSED|nr:DUF2938 domain-containing protein [Pseudomonas benzenivorans]UTW07229.1 DUF2938 domain-containing protein [Pseudomonas benzenivorans]
MIGEIVLRVILVGIGATLVMDGWALARRRLFGIASLDYALVGRWLGHMRQGRFRHEAIARVPPVPGERLLGWTCHYLIGVLFAALMLTAVGPQWLCRPTPMPALTLGALSVAAPFLLLQPAFGMGLAASRMPGAWRLRRQSLLSHLLFGLGLYLAGWVGAQMAVSPLCGG